MKTTIILFGITGDLSRRKLLPALEAIYPEIEDGLEVVGVSRRDVAVSDILPANSALGGKVKIETMDLADDAGYERLKANYVQEGCNTLVYLAVPPLSINTIITGLADAGFNVPGVKILIEKPFGTDVRSAEDLFYKVDSLFASERLYYVDHYLGKRVARAIAGFRRRARVLDDLWNSKYIERIEVVAAEQLDIEGRAVFYEQAGALRDVLQGHLMQLLALSLTQVRDLATPVPELRARVIKNLLPADPEESVHAQYDGYLTEVDNPDSRVETFASLILHSKNPDYDEIPLVLSTGKALANKQTYVRVCFRETSQLPSGVIHFGVYPETRVTARFDSGAGAVGQILQEIDDYSLKSLRWDGYTAIFVDAIAGDKTYFATEDEVLASWRAVQPVLDDWISGQPRMLHYAKGASLASLVEPE